MTPASEYKKAVLPENKNGFYLTDVTLLLCLLYETGKHSRISYWIKLLREFYHAFPRWISQKKKNLFSCSQIRIVCILCHYSVFGNNRTTNLHAHLRDCILHHKTIHVALLTTKLSHEPKCPRSASYILGRQFFPKVRADLYVNHHENSQLPSFL